jgi:hypothetical protein
MRFLIALAASLVFVQPSAEAAEAPKTQTEWMQTYTRARTTSWLTIGVPIAGIAMGVGGIALMKSVKGGRKNPFRILVVIVIGGMMVVGIAGAIGLGVPLLAATSMRGATALRQMGADIDDKWANVAWGSWGVAAGLAGTGFGLIMADEDLAGPAIALFLAGGVAIGVGYGAGFGQWSANGKAWRDQLDKGASVDRSRRFMLPPLTVRF